MKIRACSNCGSIEFVRLTVVKKRKGFLGREINDSYVTDRCFFCQKLSALNSVWVDVSLVRDDRTVPIG